MRMQSKIFVSILTIIIGGLIGYIVSTSDLELGSALSTSNGEVYRPSYSLEGGEEIAFIFIGGSSCPATSRIQFISTVRSAKRSVAAHADNLELSYVAIGVSVNRFTREGTDYLEQFGSFDEIAAGRSWLNTTVDRYVHDISGETAVPQVLLLHRRVKGREAPFPSIEDKALLLRKVGVREIKQWAATGYPVPEIAR